MRGLLVIPVAILALSGCDEVKVAMPDIKTEPIVVERTMPTPPVPPSAPVIMQDDQDAFLGFEMLDVPEGIQGIYQGQNKAMLAVMEEFNLRPLANEPGVKARAQLRTSEEGQTTWEYEIDRLPDDSVKAVSYKAYFEDVDAGGLKIALLGKRIQCYRGENPGEWTTGLCP